jgi:dihydrofolate reductase
LLLNKISINDKYILANDENFLTNSGWGTIGTNLNWVIQPKFGKKIVYIKFSNISHYVVSPIFSNICYTREFFFSDFFINNTNVYTIQTNVLIDINFSNAQKMLIGNDINFNINTGWQNYEANLNWFLIPDSTTNKKWLYIKFSNTIFMEESETYSNFIFPAVDTPVFSIKSNYYNLTYNLLNSNYYRIKINTNTNFNLINWEVPNGNRSFYWDEKYGEHIVYSILSNINFHYSTEVVSNIVHYPLRWHLKTNSIEPIFRIDHTSAIFNNKIWVIGGARSGYRNDVWHSDDGINWNQILPNNHNSFSIRDGHSQLVFDNKMWIIGGRFGYWDHLSNVYWSSNGMDWNLATASGEFVNHYAGGSLVFNNKMWLIGGDKPSSGQKNDVWYSENGSNWIMATSSSEFSPRCNISSVVFKDKMWIFGGNGLNDVWYSENGSNWICATSNAEFPQGGYISSVVYNNRIWLTHSTPYNDSNNYYNDLWWSENGTNWIQVNKTNNFSHRFGYTSVVFSNQIWIIAGKGYGDYQPASYRKEIWCSEFE